MAYDIRNLQLRRAEIKDIQNILKTEKECSLSHWSWKDYHKEINRDDSLMIVAEVENKVSGFLVARFSTGEVDIFNIGVTPTHQKLGIGGRLLKYLLDKACKMSIESIWLEVRESNANAIAFYLKRGFKQIQIRKKFYSQPVENAIVMKYALQNSTVKSQTKLDLETNFALKSVL